MKSKIVQEILDSITPEMKVEMHKKFEKRVAFSLWLEEMGYEYCTDTSRSLILLREQGFKPIGITSFYLEETFIFKTKKEAIAAFKKMERELRTVVGWFYGKKDFEKKLIKATQEGEYYSEGHSKIYWL